MSARAALPRVMCIKCMLRSMQDMIEFESVIEQTGGAAVVAVQCVEVRESTSNGAPRARAREMPTREDYQPAARSTVHPMAAKGTVICARAGRTARAASGQHPAARRSSS